MNHHNPPISPAKSGIHYFLQGFSLFWQPGVRAFTIIPLVVNVLLFSSAFYWLWLQLDLFFAWLELQIPSWLNWLSYLLWPLAVITLLALFSFIFGTIANWIAAPFNGLLAERVEQILTGEEVNATSLFALIRDLPRILVREWTKLIYSIPKIIGILLLFLIPVVGQIIAPWLWFLLTAWLMAIQYMDYPFDNHKIHFITMRDTLKQHRGKCLSFGAMVALFSAIPIINLLVMPVAICGATAMWVDLYRRDHLTQKTDNDPHTP